MVFMKVLQLVEIGNLKLFEKLRIFFLIYFSYPGTTFTDHIFRYENDPEAKILVLLGEVKQRFYDHEIILDCLVRCPR